MIAKMRLICFAHPKIETDTLRVRFAGFGPSSLDISVRVYALTNEWNEFYGIQEDLFFRFAEAIEAAGSSVAFPLRPFTWAKTLDWIKTASAGRRKRWPPGARQMNCHFHSHRKRWPMKLSIPWIILRRARRGLPVSEPPPAVPNPSLKTKGTRPPSLPPSKLPVQIFP